MMHSQPPQGGPSLAIVAHGAQNLQDVELVGKQDPYLRFSLDFNNPKSFQKTFVHKDAGKTPTWNQSFSVPLAGEPELFVEIMDEETTADAVIAFASIPINQIVHAPGGTFNGVFDVFTPAGKQQGEVNLTLTAHNVPGQNTGYGQGASNPVKGTSHINVEHQKRIKSLKNKEVASDVGGAALGGLLAVGAGFLANKLVNDNKKEEEARKEAERKAQADRESFDNEKRRLEEERATFERTQTEERARIQQQQNQHQNQNQNQGQHQGGHQSGHHDQGHSNKSRDEHKKKKKHGSDSDSSSDSDSDDDRKKNKKGKEWDGGGKSYSTGDKVKYRGDKYSCIQSHRSQHDWAPNVVPALWGRN